MRGSARELLRCMPHTWYTMSYIVRQGRVRRSWPWPPAVPYRRRGNRHGAGRFHHGMQSRLVQSRRRVETRSHLPTRVVRWSVRFHLLPIMRYRILLAVVDTRAHARTDVRTRCTGIPVGASTLVSIVQRSAAGSKTVSTERRWETLRPSRGRGEGMESSSNLRGTRN